MRTTAIILAFAVLAIPNQGRAASAEPWADKARFGVLGLFQAFKTLKAGSEVRASLRRAGSVPACPVPEVGTVDHGRGMNCAAAIRMSECGLFGMLCPEKIVDPMLLLQKGPVQTGFKALGGAGAKGKIDGPGWKGNGTFYVYKNDPYEISMWIATGYVEGVITIKRDKKTGRDRSNFKGRYWDQDKGDWGPQVDGGNDVVITYDAGRDKGRIRWKENGKWKQERYWGGKSGKSMTIELAGGWDHDFKRK